MSLPSVLTVRVVGVSFCASYPLNLYNLREVAEVARESGEGVSAVLIRNPDNPHDRNSIEVHVPSVGRVGSIPRTMAERLAPALDAGEKWEVHVADVLVSDDAPDKPGITLRLERHRDRGD